MENIRLEETKSVLYLGANPEHAQTLEEHLRESHVDCAIETATTVEEAVDLIDERYFSALVVERDGRSEQIFSDVRHCLDRQSDLLTLVMTDRDSPAVVERAYDVGVDELVQTTGEAALKAVERELEDYLGGEAFAGDARPERRVESIAETTSDAILSIDEDSVIRYANPAVEDVFGYEPSALVGEPITVLMPDELGEEHRHGVRRYLETGRRTLNWEDIELPGQHRDGHEIPLSISFSEYTVDSTRYFTGVVRDIRERKRLEAERELYHDVTQRILQADSFEDGVRRAIDALGSAMNWAYGEAWIRGADDRIRRVSDPYVATDAAGTFAEETLGVVARDEGLVGDAWESGSYQWVDDVTGAESAFERTAAAERAGFGAALAVPIVSDGSVVATMLFALPETREVDESMVEATQTVAADLGHLMKRLRAESVVREERRLKDRVLETSPVGLVILEPDGTFRYVNDRASEILGLSAFEGPITDENVDVDLLSFEGDSVTDEARPHRRVIEDGAEISGEARVEVDGETRWITVNGAPLPGDDGSVTGAVFSLQDVTERRERERQLEQYETVLQAVDDGVYALDEAGRFVLVNDTYADLLGYERSELIGEPAREFVGDRLVDEADAVHERLVEGDTDEATLEATLTTASGETVPIETRIVSFELSDGRTARAGVVRDITRQKRREERLAALNEIGQSLTTAETRAEVADVVVEGASEVLGLPLVSLEYYDEVAGELQTAARTPALRDLVGNGPVFDAERDVVWESFSTDERQIVSDVETHPDVDAEGTPLESALVFPLGSHGVFLAGATTPDAFSDTDVQVARILVSNAHAALDRVERERELRERKSRLEDHNESLERVNRINDTIRSLTRELTRASTREEIETAVCEELSSASPYVFAWIGEQRGPSDEILPRASAGRDEGYLDAITVTASEGDTGNGPAGTAFRSREPVVQNNLQSDPPFEPWRTEALRRNYRSSISIPLTYRDTTYGLLNLYADETDVFDDTEVAVLAELGEMVGYAINALERKKALVSDAAVELTFELDDRSVPAIQFAVAEDARFEFETLVEQSDRTIRVFFTVEGTDPETVLGFAERSTAVESVSLLEELEEGHRYEAITSTSGFFGELLSYGAHPTAMSATASRGRVTVEFPQSGDVKSFVRMFTRTYDGAELVGKKQHDRPVQTRAEFEANYRERLTERQWEVLEIAYMSGFFEWPRETTGTELAEKLGVSQPTVSRHIRTGERKLFDVVFDDSHGQ